MPAISKPTVSTEWASSATLNNGANATANKVEPTATHKTVGYGYPEQPARNHTNWWMNAVYKWVDYFNNWITYRGEPVSRFNVDYAATTGTSFAYTYGWLDRGTGSIIGIPAGSISLSAGDGTYTVYVDLADYTVKAGLAGVPTSTSTIFYLYKVPVVGGIIDENNIIDLRTWTMLEKATVAEVTTGTDNTKFVTPAALVGFATPTASASVYGKVRLAETADLTAQSGNDVLTAGNLADTAINASTTKYGTVRLAETADLTSQSGNDVLTAGSLANSEIRASTTRYGTVIKATSTDMLNGNRAGSVTVLTPAMFNDANARAATNRTGVVLLADNADTQTGVAADIVVTPAGLSARTATETRTGVIELATVTEAATGTDTTRADTPAGLQYHSESKFSTVAAVTYTTTKKYTIAHSLGTTPTSVSVNLRVKAGQTDLSYPAGRCVNLSTYIDTNGTRDGVCISWDATNVYINVDNAIAIVDNAATPVADFISTSSKWEFVVTSRV